MQNVAAWRLGSSPWAAVAAKRLEFDWRRSVVISSQRPAQRELKGQIMGRRSEWQAAKTVSEDRIKLEHAKELLNAHAKAPGAYPVKFELKLGPTLDDLEKAQKANKTADTQKHTAKAKEIIGKYKSLISTKSRELGGAKAALDAGIQRLESKVK